MADYKAGGQEDGTKHKQCYCECQKCIGVLPFCGQHPVDPAQLSSLGLPQLTEVIFTCVECGIRAGVGWHCDSVSV